MFAGRVGGWEKMQLRVRIEPNMQGTNGEGVSGVLTVPFAPDLSTLAEYLKLTLALTVSGTTTSRIATVQLGSLTWTRTDTATITAHELIVEFEEPRWYNSPSLDGTPAWEFRWSDLRIYINGVEVTHTLPTTGSVRNDTYFAPAGLPMSMARLDAQVQTGDAVVTGNPADLCNSWSLVARAFVRVTGGWRIWERDADDWTVYPIRIPTTTWHGDPCNNLSEQRPELSGTNTWNATISRHEEFSVYHTDLGLVECPCYCGDALNGSVTYRVFKRTTTVKDHSASVWIVPDLPKRMVAIGEAIPHEYLMYRHSFPSVGVLRYWSGVHTETRCPSRNPITICSQNNFDNPETVVLHDSRDPLLWVHDGGAGNPLNEPTAEPTYCPYTAGASAAIYEETFADHACQPDPTNPGLCPLCDIGGDYPPPPGFPCCNFDGTGTVGRTRAYTESHTWVVNDNCHPYYRHSNLAARYFNTHAAPFWSYICWLQNWGLDRDGDGVAEPTPVADYWRPHQCQHIEHPALPSAIRTRRRSYLLLDALAHGTWSGWIDDLFGVPSGWVGSTRPALVEWLPPSDLQLTSDSAPRWSATGAALAFTPLGVAVTPTSATHTIELALADWNAPPYLYPAVADRVRIWLPDTAYTSITIQLVSAESETVTIATTRGTHPISHGDDTKYAGTWRRQYAALASGYSELGSDWDADGVSGATFADPARATLWQLLGARASARLRITITQTTPTQYVMEYPIFYRDSVTDAIATDNGAHTYPHVRGEQTLNWGLLVYPVAGNTPSVRLPHQPMSLYDAAALYRQLQLGQDAASTAAIMAQILGWGVDDVETGGHPAGVPRVRQMCRAVMLPYHQRLALWLINDLRECPALPTLPTRRLRLAPPEFTGDWGQWCYFAAPSRRYYLHPDENAHLWEIEGATETQRTTPDRTVGRYLITRHDMSVDGTETMQHPTKQWRIRVGTRTLARTTPFFSHASVSATVQTSPSLAIPLVVSQLRDRLYFALQPNTLEFVALPLLRQRTPRNTPRPLHALETNDRTDLPQLLIGYQHDTSVTLAILPADGTITEVWTMNGKRILIQTWGEEYAIYAWILGQDSRVRMRVSRDHARTWTSATDCTLDGAPFDADDLGDCTLDRRHRVLYLTYKRNATVAIARSTDGINWETCLT